MPTLAFSPARALRWTTDVFVVPVGEGFLVYAPLRRAAFLARAPLVNRMADLRDGAADGAAPENADLIGLLRRLGIVDGAEDDAPPVTRFEGPPRPTTVTLFLTTGCNLRCTYCYASAGDTPLRVMDIETAKHGIDFVVQNAIELGRDTFELAFHGGGEPTTNWKALVAAHKYASTRARETGLRLRASTATNGVISDERLDWIIAHLDGASLSIDGIPEVHDAHRVDARGKGSSSAVLHTIERLDAAGFPYGLRVTVTRDSIPRLAESIRFLCARFHPKGLQVEPAYQLGRWSGAPSAETEDFLDAFRAARAEARALGQDISFSGARLGTASNHFCGVSQDNYCVTADGSVSSCYEVFLEGDPRAETFLYGRYDASAATYRFDADVLDRLRRRTVDQLPYCQGCFAKWSCGGDCFHKALAVGGPDFQGTERCHVIRELTLDQILERISDSGGLVWHDLGPATSRACGKEFL